MPRLIWSPSALRDVQRLYRFLAGKDVSAATRAAAAIRGGVKILAAHPELGRPVKDMDMDPEYREWLIDFGGSGYVVLYRFARDVDTVMIVAARHQREID